MQITRISQCLALATLLIAPAAHAQELAQSLVPQDVENALTFGSDLAVDGNTLVISDMGEHTVGTSCGSINDGSVSIYVRNSPNAPWPTVPTQKLTSDTRESHFGEYIYMKGNTLLIAEPRAEGDSPNDQDGAFHYYKRQNENSPFQWVDSAFRPADAEGPMFTLSGMVSNGKYVAAVSLGNEPNLRIYKLGATAIEPLYDIVHPGPGVFSYGDQLAMTDNDVLVVAQDQVAHLDLYKLTDSGPTLLDATVLALTDSANEVDHLYTGKVATKGRDIVVSAQRRASPASPLSYYLRVFTTDGPAIELYGDAQIPSGYNSDTDYVPARDGLGVAPGPVAFANLVGIASSGSPIHTFGFEYDAQSSTFDLAMETDMLDINPEAGRGHHQDYGQPIAYESGKLYIGDSLDSAGTGMCRTFRGSVRVFDVELDTNPSQLCVGAQDVHFRFPPVPGATAYSWWASTEASITHTNNEATIDFGNSASQATVTMGVNLSTAPYYATYTANVTLAACDVAGGTVTGNWYQCSGAQGFEYSTEPVTGATSYNWWTPGGTIVSSNGPTAVVNFLQNFDETTVNVGINLSAAPHYVERSMVVNQMACGERNPPSNLP